MTSKSQVSGPSEPRRAVLTGKVRKAAEAIIAKYPNSRSAILPLLFLVQSVEGHVTENGMRDVAEILGLTPAEVLASGSFYTMLKRRPQGEYLVSVCRNISCTHLGSRKVMRALESELGIGPGETTADGKFSLEAAECLATCDGAPSLQINYEDFYKVTPEDAVSLVERLTRGDDVRGYRGDRVRTASEVAYETATAGAGTLQVAYEETTQAARTVGGESPPADMAPGVRPPILDWDDKEWDEDVWGDETEPPSTADPSDSGDSSRQPGNDH